MLLTAGIGGVLLSFRNKGWSHKALSFGWLILILFNSEVFSILEHVPLSLKVFVFVAQILGAIIYIFGTPKLHVFERLLIGLIIFIPLLHVLFKIMHWPIGYFDLFLLFGLLAFFIQLYRKKGNFKELSFLLVPIVYYIQTIVKLITV